MTQNGSPEQLIIDYPRKPPSIFTRMMRWLGRLLLTVLVGAAIGGAIYFGGRSFYNQAVLVPAQGSVTRMDDLASRQAEFESQAAAEITSLHDRISQLEKNQKADAEEISSLQAEVLTMNDQLVMSQDSLGRLAGLEQNLSAIATQTMKNQFDLKDYLGSSGSPVNAMRREIQILRAMELLNRCRLYLSQSNYGLAIQDANLVRQIFLDVRSESAAANQAIIDTWINRLDLALTNLNVAPVVAGEDLESVWRMVLAGLPEQGAALPPAETFTPTPWVTPTIWITPTPVTSLPTPIFSGLTPTPVK
jgi:hypothetical protein